MTVYVATEDALALPNDGDAGQPRQLNPDAITTTRDGDTVTLSFVDGDTALLSIAFDVHLARRLLEAIGVCVGSCDRITVVTDPT